MEIHENLENLILKNSRNSLWKIKKENEENFLLKKILF